MREGGAWVFSKQRASVVRRNGERQASSIGTLSGAPYHKLLLAVAAVVCGGAEGSFLPYHKLTVKTPEKYLMREIGSEIGKPKTPEKRTEPNPFKF